MKTQPRRSGRPKTVPHIPKAELTQELLRRDFRYVKSTGKLYRKFYPPYGNGWAEVGGNPNKITGYCSISYCHERYYLHRFVYFLVTGTWPIEVDHKDLNRSNNKWKNLRGRDKQFNRQNIVKPRSNNRSGFLGVTFHDGRYRATIKINGEHTGLGRFRTPEEASAAYIAAKRKYHAGNTL